jgi:hypothetical protein
LTVRLEGIIAEEREANPQRAKKRRKGKRLAVNSFTLLISLDFFAVSFLVFLSSTQQPLFLGSFFVACPIFSLISFRPLFLPRFFPPSPSPVPSSTAVFLCCQPPIVPASLQQQSASKAARASPPSASPKHSPHGAPCLLLHIHLIYHLSTYIPRRLSKKVTPEKDSPFLSFSLFPLLFPHHLPHIPSSVKKEHSPSSPFAPPPFHTATASRPTDRRPREPPSLLPFPTKWLPPPASFLLLPPSFLSHFLCVLRKLSIGEKPSTHHRPTPKGGT